MRGPNYCSALVGVVLTIASCRESTSSATTLTLTGPPDFVATVTSNTHQEFFAPSGNWISQYELWVALPPSSSANAGVVVGASRPVFLTTNGVLEQAKPADITSGDVVQVWHDVSVAYGSMQAPPGSPAYSATQIVIVRSGQ